MKASNGTSSRTAPPGASPRNADSSSSTAERFALTGPSLPLDSRVHAYRRDIADIALAGQIIAPHYARPLARTCVEAATVREAPKLAAEPVAELARGDAFAVLEYSGGWAWGYTRTGHLVGYVEEAALGACE